MSNSLPNRSLSQFGVGVGLYFGNLITLSVILAVAAIMNIPNVTSYAGQDWSAGQQTLKSSSNFNDIVLIGSAYCDLTSFVSCPTCDIKNFNEDATSPLSLDNRYVQDTATGNFYFRKVRRKV